MNERHVKRRASHVKKNKDSRDGRERERLR